jgi:phosphatidylinositol alpha-1,6-mannosyltransferase
VRTVRAACGADEFLLLSIGRLVARKGFDDCIRAVANLAAEGLSVRYAIVGDGPARRDLEKLAADIGAGDRVRFIGTVTKADLAAHFAACDAFVMTPKMRGADVEGFGIVYLEAGLFGKPVIGSRSGGVPDAVLHEKTGLLVEPGKHDAIAAAVRRLAADKAFRDRLGDAGRRRVLEEFSPERAAERFLAAVRDAVPNAI